MGKQPWELAIEARRVNYAGFATSSDGYERWDAGSHDGDRETVYVHQLLAVADGADPSDLFGGDAQVHHRNGVPWDNRPENIDVKTVSDHASDHHSDRWGDAPWRDPDAIREGLESNSVAALADAWGCSTRTIRDWRRRHGMASLEPGRKPDKNEKTT